MDAEPYKLLVVETKIPDEDCKIYEEEKSVQPG
jgi:hypothetical protein